MSTPDTIYSVRNAADYLKLTENTITQLLRKGEIKGSFVASRWRMTLGDLQSFIENGRKR
jgi:excisionase family DNA binding protein